MIDKTGFIETCDECGSTFYPDGETNFIGSPDGDEDCSPFTVITSLCEKCFQEKMPALFKRE